MALPRDEVEVAIIGAGAAGIGAGRRLMAHGVAVLALEARDRIGGRAVTRPAGAGGPIDLGCEWLHSADRNPWTTIARSLGRRVDEILPDWSRRIANQIGEAEQDRWIAVRQAFEARCAAAAKAPEDCAAAALLEPGERWNPLLDAISSWANGVELDRLSVRDHDRYADSGINWRLPEGYGSLIAEYGAPVPVALRSPVRQIDWRGPDVALETPDGTLRARAAIVTLPSNLIAASRPRFVPALPAKAEAASGLPLGLANKLFLGVTSGAEDLPVDRHILGAADRTATGSYQLRPFGRPIIAGFFGGRHARALEEAGPAAFAAFAIDELVGLFGGAIRPRLVPLASSAWATDPWATGSYSYALPGHAEDRAILAAPVAERLFFAGEACSPDDFSTAHGAYLTGLAAADAVLAALATERKRR